MTNAKRIIATHLALFFYEPLHQVLAAGKTMNGICDLEDVVLLWEDLEDRLPKLLASCSDGERASVMEFDTHVLKAYLTDSSLGDGVRWNWLFDLHAYRPETWSETVHLAQEAFHSLGGIDLKEWESTGYRLI